MAPKRDQLLRLVLAPPLSEEVTSFLIDKEAQGLSKGTIRLHRVELGYFHHYLQQRGVQTLLGITPNTLRRWLLHLAQTRNPGCVHVNYRVLKTFFRWCWLEYEIESSSPITRVKPPRLPQDVLLPVSLDSLKTMLDVCPRKTFTGCRDRAILLALLDTGCRAGEFLSTDVGDIDLASGAVWVRQAKGGKSRVTFLGAKARRELVRYLRRREDIAASAPYGSR